MLVLQAVSKKLSRSICSSIFLVLASVSGLTQQTPGKASAEAGATKHDSAEGQSHDWGRQSTGSASSEAPPILQQLNSALESLVAKLSPAVVQIQVTGYGLWKRGGHGETALIGAPACHWLRSHCGCERLHRDQRPRGGRSASHSRGAANAFRRFSPSYAGGEEACGGRKAHRHAQGNGPSL